MIYLLHGPDTYSLRAYLDELRAAVGMPDVQDANITWLSAQEAEPATLLGMCQTVPFLAERRMVVVEGLLGSLAGEGRGGKGRASSEKLAQWQEFLSSLAENIPPSSDLVLMEGQLRVNHPLLPDLKPIAEAREFGAMNQNDLRGWVQNKVMQTGGSITTNAVQLLVDMVGSDLWALSGEVEKLSLYAAGRTIEVEDVEELVVSAREVNVFAVVDAVLEGNRTVAMRNLTRLLEGEATVPYLLGMLGRQVRLLLLAKELLQEQVPQGELGSRLGINSAYPLRKTLEQARRFTPQALRQLHTGLLDTDVAIKTGAQGERLALEFLVAEVCQTRARPR